MGTLIIFIALLAAFALCSAAAKWILYSAQLEAMHKDAAKRSRRHSA
jgi:hypothetical protein